MSADRCQVHPDKITIRPHGLGGWKTVLNHVDRELSRQFHILGLGLPFSERIPYSKVVRVKLISGALGVGRPGSHGARKGLRPSLSGLFITGHRHHIPDKGTDYRLMVTVQEGVTFKIGPISADIAKDVERQFRRHLGLPDNF